MPDATFEPEQAFQYAEDLRNRVNQLQTDASETEIEVKSRDKSITVVVTISGRVTDLALDNSAIANRDSREVASAILSTIRSAQNISEKAGEEMVNKYMPNASLFKDALSSALARETDPR